MESRGPIREYTEAEIKEENKRIRHLRRLVDFSLALIAQSPMSPDEARRIVQAVRQQAMRLFPGKEATFELLYTPRFRRLIAEKFNLLYTPVDASGRLPLLSLTTWRVGDRFNKTFADSPVGPLAGSRALAMNQSENSE